MVLPRGPIPPDSRVLPAPAARLSAPGRAGKGRPGGRRCAIAARPLTCPAARRTGSYRGQGGEWGNAAGLGPARARVFVPSPGPQYGQPRRGSFMFTEVSSIARSVPLKRERPRSWGYGGHGGLRELWGYLLGDDRWRHRYAPRVYLTITCLSGRPWTNPDAPSSSALHIEHHGAAEKDHPHHLLPHRHLTRGAPTQWHERNSGCEQKPAYGKDEPQPLPPIARGVSGRMILGQHAHQTKIHRGAGISIPLPPVRLRVAAPGWPPCAVPESGSSAAGWPRREVDAAPPCPFGQKVERSFYCRSCR